ncbi:MAG: hypothetical protein ACRDJE_21365, partial [Dehalococcoidia bacterium]
TDRLHDAIGRQRYPSHHAQVFARDVAREEKAMPVRLDMDEILSRNPQVDREELEAMRELLSRLREQRVLRKRYDPAPIGGRRITVRDDARADPRIVRLKPVRDDAE